jgi:hypothetical protein
MAWYGLPGPVLQTLQQRDEIAGITGIRKFYLIPLYATSFIQ